MAGENNDTAPVSARASEEAMEDAREVAGEKLGDSAGGVNIRDHLKAQKFGIPPIVAPTLNPLV